MPSKGGGFGLLLTVAFHLVLIIVLLLVTIHSVTSGESSFVLDFTRQEELEERQKEMELKEEINRELDNLMAVRQNQKIRNVAVDEGLAKGENLKDDRFKNPNEVYDDARELQRRIDANRRDALRQAELDKDLVDIPPVNDRSDGTDKSLSYNGPSVISWSLEGRSAISLPVPAYKGFAGGDVAVNITVNRKGRVIHAEVMQSISANDIQLQQFAIDAAKRSRFSASSTAREEQEGQIVYRFIPQ